MISYDEYYAKYLGLKPGQKQGILICNSALRDRFIGSRHPLVLSFLNRHQVAVSLSSDLFRSFSKFSAHISAKRFSPIQWLKIIDDFVFDRFKTYNVGQYIRLTIKKDCFAQYNKRFPNVRALKAIDKNLVLNQGNFTNRGMKYKNYCWEQILPQIKEERTFAIIKGNRILSRASVDPIECGSGNISVTTDSDHRGKGYGKAVVSAAVEWCFEKDILPVYYARSDNIASLALAKSLGFTVMNREIIVNHWPGDAKKV